MRNVTVSLDDETARWLRVEAAKKDISVSRFIAALVDAERCKDDAYWRAYQAWLAMEPVNLGGGPYPRREELYDRPGLR
jgi:hypothetical protein